MSKFDVFVYAVTVVKVVGVKAADDESACTMVGEQLNMDRLLSLGAPMHELIGGGTVEYIEDAEDIQCIGVEEHGNGLKDSPDPIRFYTYHGTPSGYIRCCDQCHAPHPGGGLCLHCQGQRHLSRILAVGGKYANDVAKAEAEAWDLQVAQYLDLEGSDEELTDAEVVGAMQELGFLNVECCTQCQKEFPAVDAFLARDAKPYCPGCWDERLR